MNNRIQDAFGGIKADEALKEKTLAYLQKQKNRQKRQRYFPAVVICVLVTLMCGTKYASVARPVSFISIDINPSIGLELNTLDQVIFATGYNSEGAFVLDGLSLKGKPYQEAIKLILESPKMQQYLEQNEVLEFALASAVKGKDSGIQQEIRDIAGHAGFRTECEVTDVATAHAACCNNISIAKYTAYLQLQEYDTTITLEDCRHHSISELHEQLSGHGTSHHGYGGADGQNFGNGHHHSRH